MKSKSNEDKANMLALGMRLPQLEKLTTDMTGGAVQMKSLKMFLRNFLKIAN